jgi:thiol:disulfide interchange protein DsbA
MRLLKTLLLACCLIGGAASASPDNPQPGKEYATLPNPQPPVAQAGKVEVIEFFMYHCPACYGFEPTLNDWVKAHEGVASFRRVHIPHYPENDPEAHLFLTLDAMQLEGAMHEKVEHTWHVDRHRLATDADNLDWAVSNGIDRQKFLAFYNGFSVTAKLRNLSHYTGNYGVNSTPTLVIDGRYVTDPAMVAQANPGIAHADVYAATLKVVDALIEQARKQKH